jgi:hypothetical protein
VLQAALRLSEEGPLAQNFEIRSPFLSLAYFGPKGLRLCHPRRQCRRQTVKSSQRGCSTLKRPMRQAFKPASPFGPQNAHVSKKKEFCFRWHRRRFMIMVSILPAASYGYGQWHNYDQKNIDKVDCFDRIVHPLFSKYLQRKKFDIYI